MGPLNPARDRRQGYNNLEGMATERGPGVGTLCSKPGGLNVDTGSADFFATTNRFHRCRDDSDE